MTDLIADKLDEIRELCRKRGVTYLALFGSAACGDFDPDRSDVDFLVVFDALPPARLYRGYFGLADELEKLLGRSVDLISYKAIRNPFFQRSVEATKVAVYGRG